jgi:predicted nucleic acid-binding protein
VSTRGELLRAGAARRAARRSSSPLAFGPRSPRRRARRGAVTGVRTPSAGSRGAATSSVAAIGATTGLPVATENRRDFALIAALIERVAPPLALELRDAVF